MLKCTNHYNYGHHNNHNHWTYAIAINVYNTYIQIYAYVDVENFNNLYPPQR